ncbi:MAG: hypothetical protein FJ197_12725 [Gammaproteobacteria bacterium]|nr:hypothetical protein [Gammaproteobacteria bacterium]
MTARKRAESIMEIPESVTALSGVELEQAKIEKIDNIGAHISNLNLSTRTDGHPNVTIRGIGSHGNTEGVGFYWDGVQNATDASGRFGDLERLEVLKGPQGTLYGGSNVGGAVKLVSRRPDLSEFGGNVVVAVGDESTRDYSATINLPITKDRVGVRLFALLRGRRRLCVCGQPHTSERAVERRHGVLAFQQRVPDSVRFFAGLPRAGQFALRRHTEYRRALAQAPE